jgi:hypothetical protein
MNKWCLFLEIQQNRELNQSFDLWGYSMGYIMGYAANSTELLENISTILGIGVT